MGILRFFDGKRWLELRGKDGAQGYTPQLGVDYFNGTPGVDGSPDTPDQIVDKVNQSDLLINKERVEGLDKLEARIEQNANGGVRVIGGRAGVQLYVNGVKKGLVQYINLIPGTGVTISHNPKQGRNDITITATGTASLTPITVTGTIDDSNTSFTAASAPNLVIVNGAAYRNGKGATISGTAITLDNPVGTGGDIYAI